LRDNVAAVEEVAQLMKAKASVLVCVEADPQMCHRTRLARAVSEKTRLPVRHLEAIE